MIVTPAVWIVEPRWHLITSVTPQTVIQTGKTLKINRICTQHSSVTVKIGLKNLQTVYKNIMGFPQISAIWTTSEARDEATIVYFLLWSVIDNRLITEMYVEGDGASSF